MHLCALWYQVAVFAAPPSQTFSSSPLSSRYRSQLEREPAELTLSALLIAPAFRRAELQGECLRTGELGVGYRGNPAHVRHVLEANWIRQTLLKGEC